MCLYAYDLRTCVHRGDCAYIVSVCVVLCNSHKKIKGRHIEDLYAEHLWTKRNKRGFHSLMNLVK
jgi:hypothetical protein